MPTSSGDGHGGADGVEAQRAELRRASAALGLRRFEISSKCARAVLESSPQNPEAHVLLALSELGLLRPLQARAISEAGLAFTPMHVGLLIALAHSLLAVGEMQQALQAATRARELAPDLSEAHLARAMALQQVGHIREAREACKRSITLDPEEALPHRILGDLTIHYPKEAEGHYRRALELDPRDPETLNNLGVTLLKTTGIESAAQAFKLAILVDPGFDLPRRNLVNVVAAKRRRIFLLVTGIVLSTVLVSAWISGITSGDAVRLFLGLMVFGAPPGYWILSRSWLKSLRAGDQQLVAVYEQAEKDSWYVPS